MRPTWAARTSANSCHVRSARVRPPCHRSARLRRNVRLSRAWSTSELKARRWLRPASVAITALKLPSLAVRSAAQAAHVCRAAAAAWWMKL